jgi:hypothetical protein
MCVLRMTKRTGYSNTSARKMPTNTIRNGVADRDEGGQHADRGGDDQQRAHGHEQLDPPRSRRDSCGQV